MAKTNTCRAECSFSSNSTPARNDVNWFSMFNGSFFDDAFVNVLINFMHEAHSVIDKIHQQTEEGEGQMSEEERQKKIQDLVARIAEKERELSQLEAERRGLLSNYDPSSSSNSCGTGFSPPQAGVRTLPRRYPTPPALAASPATYQSSSYECDDGCEEDCSQIESSYSRYTSPSRGVPQLPPQRFAASTPIRRAPRPPAFSSTEYDSSCNPDCSDPCSQASMDSTMARWHKQLRMAYQ